MRMSHIFGLFAVISLLACISAAVLIFSRRISQNQFQALFLIASLLWFVFAVLRVLTKK